MTEPVPIKVRLPLGILTEVQIAVADVTGADGIERPIMVLTLTDVTGEKKAVFDLTMARNIAETIIKACDKGEAPKIVTPPSVLLLPKH